MAYFNDYFSRSAILTSKPYGCRVPACIAAQY